jgi:hypothetical protein
MVGVIEHQEVGELLFAQLTWHIVQCEKAIWHAREGKKSPCLVPHHHVQPEMIARERQRAAARIPDGGSERTAEHWPNIIAEFFPTREEKARVRPFRNLSARNTNPCEQFIAIVESKVGSDD